MMTFTSSGLLTGTTSKPIAVSVMLIAPSVPITCPSHILCRAAARHWPMPQEVAMSRTGVDSLDNSIDKTNVWLADVAAGFGTEDRRLAYRVTRTWLHTLRDRLPVPVAAHLAAQLPELLRGVFYDGWNPSKVPVRYGPQEYLSRFSQGAQIHH